MPIHIGLGRTGCRVVRLVFKLLGRHIHTGAWTEDDDVDWRRSVCPEDEGSRGGPVAPRGGPPVVAYDHLGHCMPRELTESAEPFEEPDDEEDPIRALLQAWVAGSTRTMSSGRR